MEDKDKILSEEEFLERYQTTHKQLHPESYLDDVSEEDKEIYETVEILTGRNLNFGEKNRKKKPNTFNKFFSNKGKKYNTLKKRIEANFKRFLENKLMKGELEDIYEKVIDQAKRGYFNQQKLIIERMLGKEEETVNLKTDGDITFKLDDSKVIDKKEDKE